MSAPTSTALVVQEVKTDLTPVQIEELRELSTHRHLLNTQKAYERAAEQFTDFCKANFGSNEELLQDPLNRCRGEHLGSYSI